MTTGWRRQLSFSRGMQRSKPVGETQSMRVDGWTDEAETAVCGVLVKGWPLHRTQAQFFFELCTL